RTGVRQVGIVHGVDVGHGDGIGEQGKTGVPAAHAAGGVGINVQFDIMRVGVRADVVPNQLVHGGSRGKVAGRRRGGTHGIAVDHHHETLDVPRLLGGHVRIGRADAVGQHELGDVYDEPGQKLEVEGAGFTDLQ